MISVLRFSSLGSRVWGLGFRVSGSGLRFSVFGLRGYHVGVGEGHWLQLPVEQLACVRVQVSGFGGRKRIIGGVEEERP